MTSDAFYKIDYCIVDFRFTAGTNVQIYTVFEYAQLYGYFTLNNRHNKHSTKTHNVPSDLITIDYICVLYGTPSAYGVVTMPFSVREGINIFLGGFVPTENLRFREEELNFKMSTSTGG